MKIVEIGELIDFVVDNRGKSPPIQISGHELIETVCINNDKKYPDYSKANKFVSDQTYKTWFRKGHPQIGDILISTVGANIGNVAIMRENRGCVAQNLVGIRTNRSKCNPDYLYYIFSSDSFQQILKGLDIGSAQPSIRVPHLLKTKVYLPDLKTQSEAAEILSSLDDKIELNNQINANLEALAQAIFKQWFIDFEFPDENGNPYKSSGGKLVDIELGLIPEGWQTGKLQDIAKISKVNIKPFDYPDTAFFHYSLPAFDELKLPAQEFGKSIKSSKFKVYPVSVLVSKLNPRFPRVWAITKCKENSICSTEFQVLTPLRAEYFSFLYCFCNSSAFSGSLISKASGTSSSHQRVKPNDMLETPLILPSSAILCLFNEAAKEILSKRQANLEENLRIKNLRDAILPRLLTGKLKM